MKLWKQNRLDKEHEISNDEIAKRFLESPYAKADGRNLGYRLIFFITSKDGLNSTWEWDENKGSINGSSDMIKILEIIKETTTK